ncbi:hypothetical protein Plec18167_002301 [Paecilomyces lecythidis]|uniref:Uncharacterized protein n=1 Tax=Paecilomyces lecythidis TaxID=3004212 RepID=A0ABR3Y8S5_9EURO
MKEESSKMSSSLGLLPLECRQNILSSITDVPTLRAAILSHPIFYYAFRNRSSFIVEKVLRSVVPQESFLEAISAFELRRIKPWSLEKAAAIVNCYRGNKIPPTFEYTIQNSLAIQKLHDAVLFFARDFATDALSINPLTDHYEDPSNSPPLSPNELRRITSSFYRHELCSSIFPKAKRFSEALQITPRDEDDIYDLEVDFPSQRYHIWELEQMACVHDYLFWKISEPFDEVAAHDIKWGAWRIPYDDDDTFGGDRRNAYKEHTTYDERYRILDSKLDEATHCLRDILSSCFDEFPRDRQIKLLRLSDMDAMDSDPFEAWEWTHVGMHHNDFVLGTWTYNLRRAGYVMWDHSRLTEWGFFDGPWQFPDGVSFDITREKIQNAEKRMMKSQDERLELYEKGLLGRYDPEGEHRLQ